MARSCTICTNPKRADIDTALLAGEACRGISRKFRVSEDALQRHKKDHIPAKLARAASVKAADAESDARAARLAEAQAPAVPLVEAHAAAEETEALSLYDRLGALNRQTQNILAGALRDGDRRTALQAIGRAKDLLEIEARMLGELDESQKIQVGIAVQQPPAGNDYDLSLLNSEEYETVKRLLLKIRRKLAPQISGGNI